MKANEILETCLYVDDLDESQRFYESVLGLDIFQRRDQSHIFFRCGNRMLLLFDAARGESPGSTLPPHSARGAGHIAFAVPDNDIPEWKTHLKKQGVSVEKLVSWPQGGHSIYFRDPSGNSLELASPQIWGLSERGTIPEQ